MEWRHKMFTQSTNNTAFLRKGIPLSDVGRIGPVKIVKLDGGKQLRNKTAALGILPGMKVYIRRPNHHGPVLVSVFGETIMVGQGLARKIMVV